MLACGFFHADCAATLRRVYVFFVIETVNCGYRHGEGIGTFEGGGRAEGPSPLAALVPGGGGGGAGRSG